MNIKFSSDEHKAFYEACMKHPGVEQKDYYRALFYTLGICPDTRQHLDSLFDFDEGNITTLGMHEDWVNDDNRKVIRMAFNLWDGYGEDIQDEAGPGFYTPEYLFDSVYAPYFVEAIKVRHPSYFDEQPVEWIPPEPSAPQAKPAQPKPRLTFGGVLGDVMEERYNKMWKDYAELGGADALHCTTEGFIQLALAEFQTVRAEFGAEVMAFVYKGIYEESMLPKEIGRSAVFISNGGSREKYGDLLRKGVFCNDFDDSYYKTLAEKFPQAQANKKGRFGKKHPRGGAR